MKLSNNNRDILIVHHIEITFDKSKDTAVNFSIVMAQKKNSKKKHYLLYKSYLKDRQKQLFNGKELKTEMH